MIDTFSILFSTIMIALVLVRAVKLDRTLPWFQAVPRTDPGRSPPPPGRGAGRPGGGAGVLPVRVRTLPGSPPPRRAGR